MLLVESGAEVVPFNTLGQVPVPAHTRSYRPVPYQDAVEVVRNTIANRLPNREVLSEEFALGRKGQHLFGLWTLDTDAEDNNLSIGMRQSYDKSLSLGLVSGGQVTVCSNLMFDSDTVRLVRKNTTNVWDDFSDLVERAVIRSESAYQRMQGELEAMKALDCPTIRGAELMGVALYNNVLRPQQATVAMRAWKDAPHAEFEPRTMWSLYNAFTEALKKGQPADMMTRYIGAHDFFRELITEEGINPFQQHLPMADA